MSKARGYYIDIITNGYERTMYLHDAPRKEANEWMTWLSQVDEILELYLFKLGGKQIVGWSWI